MSPEPKASKRASFETATPRSEINALAARFSESQDTRSKAARHDNQSGGSETKEEWGEVAFISELAPEFFNDLRLNILTYTVLPNGESLFCKIHVN